MVFSLSIQAVLEGAVSCGVLRGFGLLKPFSAAWDITFSTKSSFGVDTKNLVSLSGFRPPNMETWQGRGRRCSQMDVQKVRGWTTENPF